MLHILNLSPKVQQTIDPLQTQARHSYNIDISERKGGVFMTLDLIWNLLTSPFIAFLLILAITTIILTAFIETDIYHNTSSDNFDLKDIND